MPFLLKGKVRKRFPVDEKIALDKAETNFLPLYTFEEFRPSYV
tara:strand:+ start:25 stop:153 length:129 start_codon:yes stop_codon:yes gene_type:complete